MSSKIETVAPDKDILIRRVVKLYMQRHETIKRRKKCREIKSRNVKCDVSFSRIKRGTTL